MTVPKSQIKPSGTITALPKFYVLSMIESGLGVSFPWVINRAPGADYNIFTIFLKFMVDYLLPLYLLNLFNKHELRKELVEFVDRLLFHFDHTCRYTG